MDQGVLEFVPEDLGILVGGEVAVLLACLLVGVNDPVDELLEAPLALRRADRAAKYLVVTMLAAFTDQKSGNSTPCCSKLTEPSRQFVITTSRRSQVTWS